MQNDDFVLKFKNSLKEIEREYEESSESKGQEKVLQQIIDYERVMRCVSNPTEDSVRLNYIEDLLISSING